VEDGVDQTEQRVIDDLFGKLRQAETGTGPRDAEAERRILDHLRTQPAAPYYMAQAVIVQEHALKAAQERLEQLEQELKQRPAGGGGFLGSLFGGNASVPRRPAPSPQMAQLAQYQQRGGSGFLAGAMQTAMGVAGGLVLGNLLMSAFAGDAMAEEAPPEEEPLPEEDMASEDFVADEEF
jgi:hypothetical protein